MKTLIITGPSGSGKSYLTKNISKLFNNTIVIKTDSYYKDNIFIKFLSIVKVTFVLSETMLLYLFSFMFIIWRFPLVLFSLQTN